MLKADDRTRTDNLLITSQLLCQLSHIGNLFGFQMSINFCRLPIFAFNKYYFTNRQQYSLFNGTYRARTYDPLLVRQVLSQLS